MPANKFKMAHTASETTQLKIVQLIAQELGVGPQQEAAKYVIVKPAADNVEAINVPDAKAALDGARDILCERFAETAGLLAKLRARMWEQGIVTSAVMKGKEAAEEEKFRDANGPFPNRKTIRKVPRLGVCLT